MEEKEIKEILSSHKKWLNNDAGGVKANLRHANLQDADLQDADLQDANLRYADLQDADLQDADLRYANLRDADLQDADLRHANLQDADLRYANLQDADLQDANLRHADLDFSVFPLWCGSFGMKVDDRLVTQLLGHIARLDYSMCSKDLQKYIKKIPKKYVNTICERHSCVDKL